MSVPVTRAGANRPATDTMTIRSVSVPAPSVIPHPHAGRYPVSFTFSPAQDSTFYIPRRQSRVSMSETVPDSRTEIDLTDETDRWRYTCPHGHTRWEPTNHHFWCRSCARSTSADGVFHELRDRQTGWELDREDVRLVDDVGPYDRDLDRRGGIADD